MVINDNEHMSNHPAKFWPVSAKTGNFLVLGPKMAEIQNLLKIRSKTKKVPKISMNISLINANNNHTQITQPRRKRS